MQVQVGVSRSLHGPGSTLTFACAFKLAVLEAADAQSNMDRQITKNSPKKAVFRLTEIMLTAVAVCQRWAYVLTQFRVTPRRGQVLSQNRWWLVLAPVASNSL